jgi:hypothetical protein
VTGKVKEYGRLRVIGMITERMMQSNEYGIKETIYSSSLHV